VFKQILSFGHKIRNRHPAFFGTHFDLFEKKKKFGLYYL